jgi:hypothetical protein
MDTKFDVVVDRIAIVFGLAFILLMLIALTIGVFSGCTKTITVERTVFKPVPLEQGCKLPELDLPPASKMVAGPNGLRCLDVDNRARLAARLSRLRQWVEQVKARCGAPRADAGSGEVPSVPKPKDMSGKGERGAASDGGEAQ